MPKSSDAHAAHEAIRDIPEMHRQYMDGAITMEEMFNKMLDIMIQCLPALENEVLHTNNTVQFIKRLK